MWGVLENGLFGRPNLGADGAFYGGSLKLLGGNLFDALVISARTTLLIGGLFLGLRAANS